MADRDRIAALFVSAQAGRDPLRRASVELTWL